jgi:hypothetical protein
VATRNRTVAHIRTPTDEPTREDRLVARMEVCDQLWRTMVAMKRKAEKEPKVDDQTARVDRARLKGIQYMMDVVESHRKTAQESLAGIEKVVLQIVTNDDHYRLIPRNTLRDIMAEYEASEDKQADATARKKMWELSEPADVSSSGQVDYVIVPDDNESWQDLVKSLHEEEENAAN